MNTSQNTPTVKTPAFADVAAAIRKSGQIILRTSCGTCYTITPRMGIYHLSAERLYSWLYEFTELNLHHTASLRWMKIFMKSAEFIAETTPYTATLMMSSQAVQDFAMCVAAYLREDSN